MLLWTVESTERVESIRGLLLLVMVIKDHLYKKGTHDREGLGNWTSELSLLRVNTLHIITNSSKNK